MTDLDAKGSKLIDEMVRFVNGVDISTDAADSIAVLLDEYEGEPWELELQVALATYEPWGGSDDEPLIPYWQMANLIRTVLRDVFGVTPDERLPE